MSLIRYTENGSERGSRSPTSFSKNFFKKVLGVDNSSEAFPVALSSSKFAAQHVGMCCLLLTYSGSIQAL